MTMPLKCMHGFKLPGDQKFISHHSTTCILVAWQSQVRTPWYCYLWSYIAPLRGAFCAKGVVFQYTFSRATPLRHEFHRKWAVEVQSSDDRRLDDRRLLQRTNNHVSHLPPHPFSVHPHRNLHHRFRPLVNHRRVPSNGEVIHTWSEDKVTHWLEKGFLWV